MDVAHRMVDIGDVRLHCAEMGQGPLVLLLHGFPECWVSWRNQMPALAAAGFRAVAPDLRGYGKSDKPRGLDAYRIEVLARDVARLVEALGEKRAHVVGHDWGGAAAWHFAMWHPERLDRLAILNAPHPARLACALLPDPVVAGGGAPRRRLLPPAAALPSRSGTARRLRRRGHRADGRRGERARRALRDARLVPRHGAAA